MLLVVLVRNLITASRQTWFQLHVSCKRRWQSLLRGLSVPEWHQGTLSVLQHSQSCSYSKFTARSIVSVLKSSGRRETHPYSPYWHFHWWGQPASLKVKCWWDRWASHCWLAWRLLPHTQPLAPTQGNFAGPWYRELVFPLTRLSVNVKGKLGVSWRLTFSFFPKSLQ